MNGTHTRRHDMTQRMEGRENYRASHGTYPRGQGRWMFEMMTAYGARTFEYTGTYSQATREAFRAAREMMASSVRVMS